MNNKLVAGTAAVVALVIILAATYMLTRPVATPNVAPNTQQNDTNQKPANTETETETSPEANSESATITYTNQGFSPATLSVKSGAALRVVNNSDAPLEFSSDNHPSHRANPEMNMSTLQPGAEGTITVTTLGEHGFHDHLNASRTGVLTVTE